MEPYNQPAQVFLLKVLQFSALIFLGFVLGSYCWLSIKFLYKYWNNPVKIDHHDASAYYEGPITELGVTTLLASMEIMKTKTLYINSGGGSSEAGLKAGKYISDNNIQVVASLRCFSSCANYFFLPSKTRAVLQDTEIGMHGGYQSYWKTFLALKNKVAPKHQDHLDATLVDQKIKIKQEIELLKNAQINPAIITYSADKTLYGSNTWYIEIDGEATKYGIPQERNSVFELWFPATIHYDRWGIIISKHTIQQIPRPFISHLERAKNLAPKHPEIYLTREE